MNKEEIIFEIKKVEIENLTKENKKEDILKRISDTPKGPEVDELYDLIAKLTKENDIEFYYKKWVSDNAGRGAAGTYSADYEKTTLQEFTENELQEFLNKVKNK